jgi:putative peptidoglycan lipid II flippase
MDVPCEPADGPADSPGRGAGARLARSAGLIGAATMTSRVLGLVRDQILAYFFGAGHQMDAFNVAFRIPNLFRDLFAEGAMSAAFVPTFTRRLASSGRAEAWRLGNYTINALALVTLALVALGVLLTRPLVTAFASGYADVPGKIELAISLARMTFPFLTLVAVAAVCMGMLNSLRRFFVPALSPAMFNVAAILLIPPLVPLLRLKDIPGIYAAGIATLVGGLGQIAIQWPALRREGFRYRPVLSPRDPGLRQILVLMGPGMLGLAAVQINVLINMLLATSQGEGAISWLGYAFRIMYMPIGLFGLSVATAALPSLSRQAARDDLAAMRGTLSSALRMMLILNVPATVGLVALRNPIVSLLFERGSFAAADTAATAAALMFYAPGLIGYSAVKIAVPSFYAIGDSRTPVLVSGATVAINIALNLTLVRALGYRGLALGTALSALVNAGALLWLLRRRLDGLDGGRIGVAFAKVLLASVAMGAVAWGTEHWLHALLPGSSTLVRLVRVGAAIGSALAVLALCARSLRLAEFDEARRLILARLAGRKSDR